MEIVSIDVPEMINYGYNEISFTVQNMGSTTIADYMTYQQQLQSLEYKVETDGTVVLRNKNKETIKGLSLISTHDVSLENGKHFNRKKTKSGDENIVWFDMEPDEVVKIVNNY